MADRLRCGQVVWTIMADANGVRKERPAVLVTPDERIHEGGPVEVIAITSRVPDKLPDDHVLLPWHAQGHPRTGLNRKCAAVCSWIGRIGAGDIQSVAGLVSGSILAEIISKIPAPPAPKENDQ